MISRGRIVEILERSVSSGLLKWLLIGICVLFVWTESGQVRNDMDIFLAASEDLFAGGDIYTEKYFGIYHYFYSVLFATLIHPLTWLPIFLVRIIWSIFGLFVVWRIITLLLRFVPGKILERSGRYLLIFSLIFFSLRFIRSNLHLGQINHWILWMSLESLWLIWSGKRVLGGSVLALAINIKLLPVVFLPYLFYRGEFKAFSTVIVALVMFFVLPSLWIGYEKNNELLHCYWHRIDPTQNRHVFDHEETSFHSLTTLVSTMFVEDAQEHNGLLIKRNLIGLDSEQVHKTINMIRIVFVLLTLWFLRSLPFVRVEDNSRRLYEISYLFLASSLLFPHQQHYAFITTMPAILWLIVYLRSYTSGKWLLVTLIIVYLSFNLSLLYGGLNPILNHFKVLTWGSLLLLLLLIYTGPIRFRNEALT